MNILINYDILEYIDGWVEVASWLQLHISIKLTGQAYHSPAHA